MSVGDRLINPESPMVGSGPYSIFEVTDETVAQGAKQAAMLVKTVDDNGATLNPAAPVLGAGENHIGSVGGNTKVVQVTPVLDTAAYVAGDTLSDLITITNVVRVSNGTCILQEVTVLDEDDQGQAFDIILFSATVTLSAKNAVWNTSDADMRLCQGIVRVTSGDYVDLGINRIATIKSLGIGIQPAATSLFVGTVSQGTGTYTASGIKLKFTFLQD